MVKLPRGSKSLLAIAAILGLATLLAACSTLPAPAAGQSGSLIVAGVSFRASGVGTSPLGALGTLNTSYFSRITMEIKSAKSGLAYELSTYEPESLLSLANVEPGRYEIVKLWGQVKTDNATVTVATRYTKAPSFEVAPRSLVNLGTINWDYSFDLSGMHGKAAVGFAKSYHPVEQRFRRYHPASPWLDYKAENAAIDSSGAAWVDSVWALPPRGGFSQLIVP